MSTEPSKFDRLPKPLKGVREFNAGKGVLLLLIGALLYVGHTAFIPVALAGLAGLILSSPVEALFRLGLPRGISAVLILVTALAAVAGLVALIWTPSQQWYASAPHTLTVIQKKFTPVARLMNHIEQLTDRARCGRRLGDFRHHYAISSGRWTADGRAHDRSFFRSSQGASRAGLYRESARRSRSFLCHQRIHQFGPRSRDHAGHDGLGHAHALLVGRRGGAAEFHSLCGGDHHAHRRDTGGRGVVRRTRARGRRRLELRGRGGDRRRDRSAAAGRSAAGCEPAADLLGPVVRGHFLGNRWRDPGHPHSCGVEGDRGKCARRRVDDAVLGTERPGAGADRETAQDRQKLLTWIY